MTNPYSGEYDFVETSYVFPTTHMVAPKENTVSCSECHIKTGSRLAGLGGFYMPGRDHSKFINMAGWSVIVLTLAGILLHIAGRLFISSGKKEG